MIPRVAALCDFAQTRETLLNVMSAGITTVSPPQLPVPCPLMLALMLEYQPEEMTQGSHNQVTVTVRSPSGEALGQEVVAWDIQVTKAVGEAPSNLAIPIPLNSAELSMTGLHSVEVEVGGAVIPTLNFLVRDPFEGPTA